MKKLTALFVLFLNTHLFGQINFEKGYFINNNNEKTECFIRNIAWLYNPTDFEYKLNENDSPKIANINEIKEFNVADSYAYKRFTVKMDVSSQRVEDLKRFKEFNFVEKTVFLKYLVKGENCLYLYETDTYRCFFYTKENNSEAQLLAYKEYIIDGTDLKENNAYKQDLYLAFRSTKFSENIFQNLKYNTESLTDFFIKYNQTNSTAVVNNYESKQNKSIFNYSAFIGFSHTKNRYEKFFFDSNGNNLITTGLMPKIGFEMEYIMPFNQKKWAFFTAPNFQNIKVEKQYELISNNYPAKITSSFNYTFVEIPLGVRHYLYLKNGRKLFLNLGVNLNYKIAGNYKVALQSLSPDPNHSTAGKIDNIYSSSNNFAGLGLSLKKLNLEVRFQDEYYIFFSTTATINVKSIGINATYKLF